MGHLRGTHSRYVIGCCLIPLEICGVKNNSRRITYGIGCRWGSGGSRVVQVICTNHSNFFQILFLSSLLLLTKSITFLVLLFIMKLTKQLRDYSVDHTVNPAPPERSGRVTVRAVSSFVDLSRTTRKKIRRHDRTKFLPRG